MGNLSCDTFMVQTWKYMCEDLEKSTGIANFRGVHNPLDVRNFVVPNYAHSDIDPNIVKSVRQIEYFFNRYRFEKDVLKDDDLIRVAYDKFVNTQLRIGKPAHIKASSFTVIRKARSIIKQILGPIPTDDDIFGRGSFSKRATKGNTLSEAYLHEKLKKPTGSPNHCKWFASLLSSMPLLQEVIAENGGILYDEDTLNVSFVPKSWKTFRTVTPNTAIGSFWSYGVGSYVAERLCLIGLDIRDLQEKHKYLASIASSRCHLVTADLSAASDSFTNAVMNRVLPRAWFNLLKFGRIDHVKIKPPGKGRTETHQMASFMAMGIGYTFPVQTLIFYGLLRAIAEALGIREVGQNSISVYGDDLVYPRSMHNAVVSVFGDLGFLLNQDKSFATGYFRESCGGDFYKGVDVRPAMVDFHHTCSTDIELLSCIYKLYNALKRRWSIEQLPKTFGYLEDLAYQGYGCLHVVPNSFPDGSGLKFDSVPYWHADKIKMRNVYCTINKGKPPALPYYSHTELVFRCLESSVPGKRIMDIESKPYLWLKLSLLETPEKDPVWMSKPDQQWIIGKSAYRQQLSKGWTKNSDILYWRTVRVKKRGKKFKKLRAYTSFKNRFSIVETERSVPWWD